MGSRRAVETLQELWTEGPLDLTWECELPKASIQDLPLSGSLLHTTLVSTCQVPSLVAFPFLERPHFILSGAKARSATLPDTGSLAENQGTGKGVGRSLSSTLQTCSLQ